MSFQKGFQRKVISKVFTYKLIIDQVNVCRQCTCIHDFLIVSFDLFSFSLFSVCLTCCYSFTNKCTDDEEAACFDGCKLILPGMKTILKVFFLLITITLINNYTIYKTIQYSTYITYSSIWHFWHRTEKRERKKDYLQCI